MVEALGFVDFAPGVLGVKLTPAQRGLAAVAFDGVNPVDLPPADREIAARLFGAVERVPAEARHVVVAVCGARAGKSWLGGLRALHLALTVPLDTLAVGEVASVIIVAPDLRLARQPLRYALGAAKSVAAIRRLKGREWTDGFTLNRPDGREVWIECLPATRGGSAVRGRSLAGAVLDEAAFFRDADFVVNDAEVFRAVAPRIVPGGQVVIASTPWAEAGLVWDLYRDNHGGPRTALVAHAPTTVLRDDGRTRAMVERERDRDPDNARREFDAEFMTAGSGAFFDPATIETATDPEHALPQHHDPALAVLAGADFGFRSDASALVLVRWNGDAVEVADLVEMRPERGRPLVPSEVVGTFADVMAGFGCRSVVADHHYQESIREHLDAAGVSLWSAPGGQAGKAETYIRTRTMLREGRLRLPPHRRLLAQLRDVIAKPTPGGGLAISMPRRGGAHGDLVSALVLAVWVADQQRPRTTRRRARTRRHDPLAGLRPEGGRATQIEMVEGEVRMVRGGRGRRWRGGGF